jgi:hypothetical protein
MTARSLIEGLKIFIDDSYEGDTPMTVPKGVPFKHVVPCASDIPANSAFSGACDDIYQLEVWSNQSLPEEALQQIAIWWRDGRLHGAELFDFGSIDDLL